MFWRGAVLGFLVWAVSPMVALFLLAIAAVLQVPTLLYLTVPGLINAVVIALCTIERKYPWYFRTPDDPVPPFGQYEDLVRKIYEKLGPRVGDFYWLALRNFGYGVLYRLKPAKYKGLTNYSNLEGRAVELYDGWVTEYTCDGLKQRQINLGPFEILIGWHVRGAVLDPMTERRAVNMEFRPSFSPRKAG